jgi:hypothetical protein
VLAGVTETPVKNLYPPAPPPAACRTPPEPPPATTKIETLLALLGTLHVKLFVPLAALALNSITQEFPSLVTVTAVAPVMN